MRMRVTVLIAFLYASAALADDDGKCVQAQGSVDSGKTFRWGNTCDYDVTAFFQRQVYYCQPILGGGNDCTKVRTDSPKSCIRAHSFVDLPTGDTGPGSKMLPMGARKGC